MNSIPEIAVKNLDHLGLVAGLIDEIGIVERINELVGEKLGEIVSPGQAVKAMILKGYRASGVAYHNGSLELMTPACLSSANILFAGGYT